MNISINFNDIMHAYGPVSYANSIISCRSVRLIYVWAVWMLKYTGFNFNI